MKKINGLTSAQKNYLEELYLNGEVDFVKYKTPRRPSIKDSETKWVIEIMKLIRTLKHTPRKAQIAVSKIEEFKEWNSKRSKVKQKQPNQHLKDAENLWSKYMRMGGVMSSLKRSKKGSVKGVKKKRQIS